MSIILFLSLFLIAFVERVIYDIGPNIELVTVSILLASAYLGRRHAAFLTLLIMSATDIVLGTTVIFLFTWTGFLIPALISSDIFRKRSYKGTRQILLGSTLGISTTLFFFVWTNFGVWLLDAWGMYPNNLQGLLLSYINGVPFLRLQLLSTLLFVPLFFFLSEVARYFISEYHPRLLLSRGYRNLLFWRE